jgi:hypothetical protein
VLFDEDFPSFRRLISVEGETQGETFENSTMVNLVNKEVKVSGKIGWRDYVRYARYSYGWPGLIALFVLALTTSILQLGVSYLLV